MNDQHERLMKEIARRDKLSEGGQVPLLEALYDLQESHGALPAQVEERCSASPAERAADDISPGSAPFLSVLLSFLRPRVLVPAFVTLVLALPLGWIAGQHSASQAGAGIKAGVTTKYGVATLENLLAPKSGDTAALESACQLLLQYLEEHPDAHWFRVRLIQICHVREHLATDDHQKRELGATIEAQSRLLPSAELRTASQMPYEAK